MARTEDRAHLSGLGEFIRTQRKLAELSQRELGKLTDLSDAYLSQLERGMHEPTVRALRRIAGALNVRADTMLGYAGWLDKEADEDRPDAEAAIRLDPRLSDGQKQALLSVYRSFLADGPQ